MKKAASAVLAIFPCSRTGSTLCAQKCLWPSHRHDSGQGWTNFFEPPPRPLIDNVPGGQFALGNYYYSALPLNKFIVIL
ncbi:MAG TPA: hypothetical protein PKM72_11580, partial [Nitrospirales bacterium]|nr:hypothetical protein [Nitrospirales bacterium]